MKLEYYRTVWILAKLFLKCKGMGWEREGEIVKVSWDWYADEEKLAYCKYGVRKDCSRIIG